MSKKANIYRFQDQREFDSAFVIACSTSKAEEIMSRLTKIPLSLQAVEPVDNFPEAEEHYSTHGEGLWRGSIQPF